MKIGPIKKFKQIRRGYWFGDNYLNDEALKETRRLDMLEQGKKPLRSEIINHLLAGMNKTSTTYLEIGVRNPEQNYDKIHADKKFGVDPGLEFESNPVKFQLTSDAFFEQLRAGDVLSKDILFDVIFVDGLHLADQVWRDVNNAFAHLSPQGFVVMHDCNPPTQWHAREAFECNLTPAGKSWNGTTWKAYLKYRYMPDIQSCCIDTDWGVGVLCRHRQLGKPVQDESMFYEFQALEEDRVKQLNLMTFDQLKRLLETDAAGQ